MDMRHRIAGWSGALLLLLLAGLFIYTQVETSRIERRYPPMGEFVATADGERDLHYLRRGSGVPVVMLHGRDGTLHEFTFSIFDDVAREYDAIAVDRPGYGYSRWKGNEPLTTEVQARWINEALTRLGIEDPVLIGHSYGGAVMLQYLLEYPGQVRGAISLGGVAYMDEPPDAGVFGIPSIPAIGPLATHTVALPLGRHLATGIYEEAFRPAEAPASYVETISALHLRPSQFTATAAELDVMYASVNAISRRYDEISVPVTVIFGEADRMLCAEENGRRLYEALPEARLVLVENAGHKVHHTNPELVLDALKRLR